MGEGGANTSCPGQRERWCWPLRGRWAVLSTGRVFARRNEDEHTQCREAKGDWKCLSFEEFLDLTEEERNKGTYNEIIDEFWVKKWY
jgi:hypothetical protein